ncbi:FecR family protein [Chryseobacterium sp. 2987]|uniref:FecR family protein n=1 Tax=Chryseobacterium sp. 2987 TaxID=2817767 RepID=UPI00285BA3E3|nr:FecR family protein [Chryseobacterium sp. 2987]MDR6919505.1 hypothetical protein [Chryseobacterium sp. 2987]
MKDNEPIPYLTPEEEEEIWTNVFRATRANDRRRRKSKIFILSGLTCFIVLLGVLGYALLSPTVYTADKKEIQIVLSDKSEVTLFKGGTLTVENFFLKDTRDIFLKGDAIFKVTKSKDHPFIVHGNGYQTKVLGTVFKISQAGKSFLVDLYEGKVQVNRNEKPEETYVLHPKETFTNMGAPEIAAVMKTENKTVPKTISDKRINVNFSGCSIDIAMNVIEKNYGVKIKYPLELNKENLSITGQNANAEDIIKAIALQFNLNTKKINATTFELEK